MGPNTVPDSQSLLANGSKDQIFNNDRALEPGENSRATLGCTQGVRTPAPAEQPGVVTETTPASDNKPREVYTADPLSMDDTTSTKCLRRSKNKKIVNNSLNAPKIESSSQIAKVREGMEIFQTHPR